MSIPSSLSERIDLARARRLSTTPELSKGVFVRCYSRAASPRQAIKAQCLECVGFSRDEITTCTAYACPLWEYRPFQKKG